MLPRVHHMLCDEEENDMTDSTEQVTIKVESREGRTYVSSDDVPGLWLWGSDPERVFGDIIPAITALYRHNRALRVRVEPVSGDRWASVPSEPRRFLVRMLGAAENSNGAQMA